MAKPKYPLLCATARGIFGRRLVYREIGGVPVVSIFRPATDRKTPAQLASRQKFREIALAWNTHSQAEHETLRPFTEGKNLTIYDYYTKKYIETGEDPLGPAPEPSTTPLEFQDLINAYIIETRSGHLHGWAYGFGGIISQTFMGTVADNENLFADKESLPEPEPIAVSVGAGAETVSILAGDRIHIIWETGNIDIFFPEFSGPWLTLFLADDGSTYYDPAMTQLAHAAPSPP